MAGIKIATWNIGSLYVDFGANFPYFEETVSDLKADIFCMQEFPVKESMVDEVMRIGGFSYYKLNRTSESHINKESDMGIAIFSKFPIEQIDLIELPKPKIKAFREGKEERWHSKFFTINLCKTPTKDIVIITGHGFPFHRYNLEHPDYYNVICESFSVLDGWISDFVKKNKNTDVYLSADFNLTDPLSFMPVCNESYFDAFCGDATRPSGRKTDAVLIPNHGRLTEKKNLVLRSPDGNPVFDHNCIGVIIEI